MFPQENLSEAESLALLPEPLRNQIIDGLTDQQARHLQFDWHWWARKNQLAPEGDWVHWLLLAGRGFGKTRTGGETVREWAEKPLPAPIHLIAPTASDIRKVMVEGPSGLLACYPPGQAPEYEPSLGHKLTWPNGNIGYCFSADEPERLRGPQCCRYWADELAAWRFLGDAWDNLMFGFRIGDDIRGVITTTPKPLKLIKQLVGSSSTVVTRGSTYENRRNLSPKFFAEIVKIYEGTRIGRQELMAEILEDVEGALWTRGIIEATRCELGAVPALYRAVVAIDPAVSVGEDSSETGIICAGVTDTRPQHVYVLADGSRKDSPNQWARAALRMFLQYNCDRVVAEVNNGGDLVEANIRAVHPDTPYRAVRASRGKYVRAEPVAALYEQKRVHHVGAFPDLEDQMCGFVPGSFDGSPDRMDALVWAVYDLLIQPSETHLVQVTGGAGWEISPI
jgi:phage terminase large subunit-like protein